MIPIVAGGLLLYLLMRDSEESIPTPPAPPKPKVKPTSPVSARLHPRKQIYTTPPEQAEPIDYTKHTIDQLFPLRRRY